MCYDDARRAEAHVQSEEMWRGVRTDARPLTPDRIEIRNVLGGTVFCKPIVLERIRKTIPGWVNLIGRHAFGDQSRSTDFVVPGPGKLQLVYKTTDGSPAAMMDVCDFKGRSMAMSMYVQHGDQEHYEGVRRVVQGHLPGDLRGTVQGEVRDGRDLLRASVIDNMVAQNDIPRAWIQEPRYDEFVMPVGKIIESNAAHGTVTLPVAEGQRNAACVEVISNDGVMTKDLAIAIYGKDLKSGCLLTLIWFPFQAQLHEKLATRANLWIVYI
ncbi:hypothetical protein L208DRAFT_1376824 [Tricholoma matsutake]|nr:hypothetical protein L208DRAFT_1376824 [Tricholoma matsutake 945]